MQYGHFDDERREYVITQPDTPLPWINYLGSEEYLGIISNTAGGYSFYRDARLRRISRYRYNNAPLDLGGRYVYLRDEDTGAYWSPSWQPTQSDLEDYECRHGLGYTTITSRRAGIRAETTYVVPLGETLELWRVRLTNERATPARLGVFGSIEFCLWDAQDDATNLQRNLSIGEVLVEDGVIVHTTEYRERRDHLAFFACAERGTGFETSRDAFLGPYRGWDRPLAVERGTTSGSIAHGWQPVGVQHVQLELAPGETREVTFVLGYAENPREAKFDPPDSRRPDTRGIHAAVERQRQPGAVEAALDALRLRWDGLLGAMQVETGIEHLDRMVNTWNAYQNMVTFNLSRSASLFESGIGRGMGFRDSNQDLLGFVHMVPERARGRIVDIAATQLPTGGAYHQYGPLTKRGNDAVGSGFNDDPAWLVLAVAAYVRETGDLAILDEPVPWDNAPGSETPLGDHLRRAIDYTLDRLGPHGLPLIGRADWNDCLNLNCFSDTPGESFQTTENRSGGVAESVFIAGLFVLAAKELADVMAYRGDDDEADRLRGAAQAMVAAVDAHGWDGAWFLRAYDFFGDPVGSSTNTEGQIYIEPQGMCVMAGIGLDDGRASRALESVHERLATPHGIVLQQPAYTGYDLRLGEISSYPPGYKENGGIFCHTNPWVVIAEAMNGNPGRALDLYLRINPSGRESISDVHRCEPYVYAQMIAGPDAPTHGEAKNSWLTGTAAWNYVAATQWLVGVRPELGGLRIDPRLPAGTGEIRITRRFRGTTYRILVHAETEVDGPGPDAGQGSRARIASVARLVVDGTPMKGSLIPPAAAPGGVVRVEAFRGERVEVPA